MNFIVSDIVHENIISFDISYLYDDDPDAEDNMATNFVTFHKLYGKKYQQFPLSRFSVGEVLVRTKSHVIVIQINEKRENIQEFFQFPANRFDKETIPDVIIWIGKGLHSIFHILLAMMERKKFVIITNHDSSNCNEENINENIKSFANIFSSFLWKSNEVNSNNNDNGKDNKKNELNNKNVQYEKKTNELRNHIKQLFYNKKNNQKKLLYNMELI